MSLATLTAKVLLPATAISIAASDAAVRIRLSDEVFVSGDRARVKIKTAKDGYLVVLRVDSEGRVRVLFPVDPTGDGAVRGGKEFEVRSRGDRDAFTIAEKKGAGLVIAARSDTPFNFAPFMTGQHWNFDALVPADTSGDPEGALLTLVDKMGDGKYDYDAVPYSVGEGMRRMGPGYGPFGPFYDPFYTPMFRSSIGFYSSWPWLYGPRYGFQSRVVVPIRPFHGRRH